MARRVRGRTDGRTDGAHSKPEASLATAKEIRVQGAAVIRVRVKELKDGVDVQVSVVGEEER